MSDLAPGSVPSDIRKAECSKCGGVRNCDVKGAHLVTYHDEHYSSWTHWRILQCRGCENTFVQVVDTNSEDFTHYREQDGSEGMEYDQTIRYWPALSRRSRPNWMSEYGIIGAEGVDVETLDKVLIELYGALDNDLRMLAAIGVRTAYDTAAELLGVNPDFTFAEKMDELVREGKIGSLDRVRLETMVDAGSASAHRGWRPSPQELDAMMNLLEHFVEETFIVPARKAKLNAEAGKVKRSVPPRKPREARASGKRA